MELQNSIINEDQPQWHEDLRISGESSAAVTSPTLLLAPSVLFPSPTRYNQVSMSIDPAGNDLKLDTTIQEESSSATVLPGASLEPPLPLLPPPPLNNEDSIDSSGIGSAVGSLTPPDALNGVAKQMDTLGVTDDVSSLTSNDRCESTTQSTSSFLLEPAKMDPVQLKTKTKPKRGRPFGSSSKNKRSTAKSSKASVTTETEEIGDLTEQEAEDAAACPWPLEAVFDIEALVDRRTLKGIIQYRVKWKGYPSSANSWEPRDGLMERCHGIMDYYDLMKKKSSKRLTVTVKQYDAYISSKSHVVAEIEKVKAKSKPKQPVPGPVEAPGKRIGKLENDVKPLESGILEEVPEGREPERILGVAQHEEDLLYLVKWKSDKFTKKKGEEYQNGLTSNNTNVIYAAVLKEKFPQLAIEMYQSKLVKVEEPSSGSLTEEQQMNEAEKAMELKRLRVEKEEKELVNTSVRIKKARRSSYKSRARGDCELLNDEAAQAIAKEKKRKDRFDPDTSSSEESDGLDDEDGLDVLMDEPEEAMVVD